MSMDVNNDKFKVMNGSYEKIIIVKDEANNDVELVFSYPKMRDSNYFWDALTVITKAYDEINKKGASVEDAMNGLKEDTTDIVNLAREVVPKLTEYICNNIERKYAKELTEDEKDYYYIVILKNMNEVIITFTKLFSQMFAKDQKKAKSESP
jgi:vacuolar-type H+-ATPase subunit H